MAEARIGLTGLGTMGAALALNIADKGFSVAIHNRTPARIADLRGGAGDLAERLVPAETPAALAAALDRPRAVILMVPAGAPVDETLAALLPHLDGGDIVVDAGNADFHDTRRRAEALAGQGIGLLGLGVSGGEAGARNGPSMMAGGPAEAYDAVAEVLQAIAARYRGDPCVALLGPDGAGHFVKTVHNGIEYAEMQMIAEVHELLSRGEGRAPAQIAQLFAEWNRGPLASYLIGITARVLEARDPGTGGPVLDVIRDSAGQKGTGRWTAIEALGLGAAPAMVSAAVAARVWSSEKALRGQAEGILAAPARRGPVPEVLDADLEGALLAGRAIALSEGFALLAAASGHYGWNLPLDRVAEIWRAGCIIRSAMLDDVAEAFAGDGPPGGRLLLAPHFAGLVSTAQGALRRTVAGMALNGLPAPALGAALASYDSLRRGRGSAALIQAQRDYFGAHGFEREDAEGRHHGPWHDG